MITKFLLTYTVGFFMIFFVWFFDFWILGLLFFWNDTIKTVFWDIAIFPIKVMTGSIEGAIITPLLFCILFYFFGRHWEKISKKFPILNKFSKLLGW